MAKAKTFVDKAADRLSKAKKQASEHSEELEFLKEKTENFIKKHPFLSMGVALFIGTRIGKILRRRK